MYGIVCTIPVRSWRQGRSEDRMSRSAFILIVPLFAVIFTVLFTQGCRKETEEDKKVIISVQKAAGEKDIKEILSHLSRTYRDPQGNDYEGVKGLLLFYFFRHQKVSIFIPDIEITVSESAAAARFQAVLTGRNKGVGNILPESMGVYVFDVSFMKESGDWKITSSKWERFAESAPVTPH